MSQIRKSANLPNVGFVGVPLDDNTTISHPVLSHESSGVLEVTALANFFRHHCLIPNCWLNLFLQEYEIITSSGIPIRVYRQPSNSKSAILTYHDIGTNRKFELPLLLRLRNPAWWIYFYFTIRHIIFGLFLLPWDAGDFAPFYYLPRLCSGSSWRRWGTYS